MDLYIKLYKYKEYINIQAIFHNIQAFIIQILI